MTITAALGAAGAAYAGQPIDGAIGFQPSATAEAEQINFFHNILLWIITPIALFVAGLLLWVIIRYNSKSNPTPAKFSHNTALEIAWTTVPVLILIAIAFPSFPLLYQLDVEPTTTTTASGEVRELTEEDWITIKTYGRQWYWSYIYEDGTDEPLEFDSNMIPDDLIDTSLGQVRTLSTDYPMVVPAGKYVRLNIAASDVIHSWAMPAFKLKTDAIPGRLNQLWFKADKPGVYYGQCSELCGIRHAFMPIELRVVPESDYYAWLERSKISIDDGVAYLAQIQPLGETRLASAQEF
ncbi:MAG: cytochrome c oxidase subunit II [Pseudomonadota bacterium]